MSWSDEWRRVRAIVWKDLTTERRSKSGLNAVAFMGILVLLLFGFALCPYLDLTFHRIRREYANPHAIGWAAWTISRAAQKLTEGRLANLKCRGGVFDTSPTNGRRQPADEFANRLLFGQQFQS